MSLLIDWSIGKIKSTASSEASNKIRIRKLKLRFLNNKIFPPHFYQFRYFTKYFYYPNRGSRSKGVLENFQKCLVFVYFRPSGSGFTDLTVSDPIKIRNSFKRFSTWCHEDQERRGPRRRSSPSGCQAPESSPRCPLRSEWTRCRIPEQTGIMSYQQSSGSMTFWYGTKDSDQYLLLTDPAPTLVVSDLQDATKHFFLCLLLLKVYLQRKTHKKVTKQ